MNHSATILDRYFDRDDEELLIGGVPVNKITALHGTPVFIYDRSVIEDKLALLRDALPAKFDVFYSIKANPNQAILRFFISKGCGLEVASAGELHQARTAGCAAERIFFAGPGKTLAELESAVSQQIGEIHVESPQEIDNLVAITRRLGMRVNISIRVNPVEEAQGGAMRMGGIPSPFGVDEETLNSVLDHVMGEKSLVFRGIHLFTGTQILDHEVLIRQYRKGLEIAKRAAARVGRGLATVDFGGGLGIPYFAHEQELDLGMFKRGLLELTAEQGERPEFAGTTFVVEPGRFLVGESGVYVTRVTAVKESRGKKYVVVDGGMNHHLAASGNLGQVIKRNFPVAILNKLGGAPSEPTSVVGPLCTPLDLLARDVILPQAEVGDLIGIFQSGAYARTASPLGFLSHRSPAEVMVHAGVSMLIRRRGSYASFLDDQCIETFGCEDLEEA